jgi:hypothetical protein
MLSCDCCCAGNLRREQISGLRGQRSFQNITGGETEVREHFSNSQRSGETCGANVVYNLVAGIREVTMSRILGELYRECCIAPCEIVEEKRWQESK